MTQRSSIRCPRLDLHSIASYHYPPDVLELLVDTIPRLIKSKAGLLDFFEQAGTPEELITEWRTKSIGIG